MQEKAKRILKRVKEKLSEFLGVIKFVTYTMKGYTDGEEREEYD